MPAIVSERKSIRKWDCIACRALASIGDAVTSMAKLQYATSAYDRDRGNLPELPVVNLFVEEAPAEEQPTLQSRPGLTDSGTTMGAGPVKTLFQIDGVLDGSLFGVSGTSLYKSSTNLGLLDGSGPARIDGFENRLFATQGTSLFQYDGTTLALVSTPGGFNVLSLCVGTSRLIVIDKGTGKFYWSDVLSPSVDALSFATAENSPDKLKECLFIGDTLHLFGSETVEFWPASSSNPDLPYQPLVGRTYSVGIRDTGCAAKFATTFAWITNHNQICVGEPQNVISNPALDEKIAASATASLWTFYLDGVEFLAVTLDTKTYVFSKRSSQWSTFESYGQSNWIPRCYAGDKFGSSIDGRLVEWSDTYDDFGAILERRFRAGIPIISGTTPLFQVNLKTNPGQTPYLTGTYADPSVELRASRDGGFNWGDWKAKSLGTQGSYRKIVRWSSLGFFGNPGILVEIRVTDPVPFRVSDMTANESYATF